MKEKQSLPSAPILIETLRFVGYSFETAIADLIDNCIAAEAKRIDIVLIPSENPNLIIFDNGHGMSKKELEEALRYGARNPLETREENDLGRFGIGLKSASLSQCRKVVVVSKKNEELSAFSWDIDYVIQKQDWALLEYEEDEIKQLPNISLIENAKSGTYVLLQNFDKIATTTVNLNVTLNNKMSEMIDHLALVFHRYLEKSLDIYVNNKKIIPRDPFLTTHKSTMILREQNFTIEGKNIKIKPFVLPHINKLSKQDLEKVGGKEDLRNNQGFYVYRNKRLIIWGTWFRLTKKEELGKLARVMVDIPSSLDYMWNIDIKKSSATLPDIIKKNLFACIDQSILKSKTVHEFRGTRTKNNKDISYIWERYELREGCYEYRINRNMPQLKLLEESLDGNQLKALDRVIKNIEESFPTSTLYLDASQGKVAQEDIEKENDEKIEKLYEEIKSDLEYCIKIGKSKDEMLKLLLNTEPYCYYEKLKDKFEYKEEK